MHAPSSERSGGLYKSLDLPYFSTAEEVRTAFKALALRYHPDKNLNDPTAENKFKDIRTAYDILSDDELKRKYDGTLRLLLATSGGGATGRTRGRLVGGDDLGSHFSSLGGNTGSNVNSFIYEELFRYQNARAARARSRTAGDVNPDRHAPSQYTKAQQDMFRRKERERQVEFRKQREMDRRKAREKERETLRREQEKREEQLQQRWRQQQQRAFSAGNHRRRALTTSSRECESATAREIGSGASEIGTPRMNTPLPDRVRVPTPRPLRPSSVSRSVCTPRKCTPAGACTTLPFAATAEELSSSLHIRDWRLAPESERSAKDVVEQTPSCSFKQDSARTDGLQKQRRPYVASDCPLGLSSESSPLPDLHLNMHLPPSTSFPHTARSATSTTCDSSSFYHSATARPAGRPKSLNGGSSMRLVGRRSVPLTARTRKESSVAESETREKERQSLGRLAEQRRCPNRAVLRQARAKRVYSGCGDTHSTSASTLPAAPESHSLEKALEFVILDEASEREQLLIKEEVLARRRLLRACALSQDALKYGQRVRTLGHSEHLAREFLSTALQHGHCLFLLSVRERIFRTQVTIAERRCRSQLSSQSKTHIQRLHVHEGDRLSLEDVESQMRRGIERKERWTTSWLLNFVGPECFGRLEVSDIERQAREALWEQWELWKSCSFTTPVGIRPKLSAESGHDKLFVLSAEKAGREEVEELREEEIEELLRSRRSALHDCYCREKEAAVVFATTQSELAITNLREEVRRLRRLLGAGRPRTPQKIQWTHSSYKEDETKRIESVSHA